MNLKFAGVAVAALLAGSAASAQDVIGYITKSATNAGWMMINQGAADAAAAEGVNLVSVGPAFQGDLSSQLEVFENLVAQGAAAIAIAPVDSAGIAPAVNDAMGAGIPVIAIDTGVAGAEVTSFVATDNYAVAKVQGAVAATQIEDGQPIIYVTGNLCPPVKNARTASWKHSQQRVQTLKFCWSQQSGTAKKRKKVLKLS